ncbi:Tn3 family transposase [Mycobacteroides abscessus]|uniref:Tn3 family transposase n=1 Tax=Mycobacteroides abscessus TaxID=36809 RepID=UPI000C263330|nr:Tn3 family transposase [Mycobacteroides abscessus]
MTASDTQLDKLRTYLTTGRAHPSSPANTNTLSRLADAATSPNALTAYTAISSWHQDTPNLALWAGAGLSSADGVASHILVMGVHGVPSARPNARGRTDNPYWYINEAVGGRRDTPIPMTEHEALEAVRALNDAAVPSCPAPDLLALTGWYALMKNDFDVRAAVASRRAPTHRLWMVHEAFLAARGGLHRVA